MILLDSPAVFTGVPSLCVLTKCKDIQPTSREFTELHFDKAAIFSY